MGIIFNYEPINLIFSLIFLPLSRNFGEGFWFNAKEKGELGEFWDGKGELGWKKGNWEEFWDGKGELGEFWDGNLWDWEKKTPLELGKNPLELGKKIWELEKNPFGIGKK